MERPFAHPLPFRLPARRLPADFRSPSLARWEGVNNVLACKPALSALIAAPPARTDDGQHRRERRRERREPQRHPKPAAPGTQGARPPTAWCPAHAGRSRHASNDPDAPTLMLSGCGAPLAGALREQPCERAAVRTRITVRPTCAAPGHTPPHLERARPHTPHALAQANARSQLLHKPARLERRKRRMVAPPQMAAPSPAVTQGERSPAKPNPHRVCIQLMWSVASQVCNRLHRPRPPAPPKRQWCAHATTHASHHLSCERARSIARERFIALACALHPSSPV